MFLAKNVKHNEKVSENVFVTSYEVKSEAGQTFKTMTFSTLQSVSNDYLRYECQKCQLKKKNSLRDTIQRIGSHITCTYLLHKLKILTYFPNKDM